MIAFETFLAATGNSPGKTGDWFHGADESFSFFDHGMVGKMTGSNTAGFWFTNEQETALWYGEHLFAAELEMESILWVTHEQFAASSDGPPAWAFLAKRHGYDAVIIQEICDGHGISNVCCVFEPGQIRGRWLSDPLPMPGIGPEMGSGPHLPVR